MFTEIEEYGGVRVEIVGAERQRNKRFGKRQLVKGQPGVIAVTPLYDLSNVRVGEITTLGGRRPVAYVVHVGKAEMSFDVDVWYGARRALALAKAYGALLACLA